MTGISESDFIDDWAREQVIDAWSRMLVLRELQYTINDLSSPSPERRLYGRWFIRSEQFTVLCDGIGLVPSVTRQALMQRAREKRSKRK